MDPLSIGCIWIVIVVVWCGVVWCGAVWCGVVSVVFDLCIWWCFVNYVHYFQAL